MVLLAIPPVVPNLDPDGKMLESSYALPPVRHR